MNRFKSSELLNQKSLFVFLGAVTITFLVYVNLPSQRTEPCGIAMPEVLIVTGNPVVGEKSYTYNVSRNIFVREKFQIIDLISGSAKDPDATDERSVATKIDLLYNTRKLTLFAVHELNAQIAKSEACADVLEKPCPKWWANPLNTLAIKTFSYSDYFEHSLTFIAEPGSIPYFVRVRQNHIPPTGTDWTELEIQGNFVRLDDPTHALSIPLPDLSYNATNIENEEDPELSSWPRNTSFMVGDYVDFKDPGLYLISPGGLREKAQTLYCGDALKMLVMVSSKPDHYDHRQAIRKSYGSAEYLEKLKVRVVFLFGISSISNSTLQLRLEKEAEKYDDIIQANFIDSYHNLSLSHLSMYNWVQETCEEVGLPKFVLKADDDFFLNIELALRVAYHNQDYELIGTSFCHTAPVRDVNYMTKYYTPRYMHMADRYAGYLSGVAYLVRTDIFPRMLKISLTTPMIHMDDAYITGMLPRQLNIYPVGSSLFTYGRSKQDPCSMKEMVCSYILSTKDMLDQWQEFTKPVNENCNLTRLDSSLPIQTPDDAFRNFCNYV